MLWIKAFHIISMVTWFAGLFYLPRLYVYHAMTKDAISLDRFNVMERRLYYGIMTPGGLLTSFFGVWLIYFNPHYYLQAGWFHTKLLCIVVLWIYHLYLGHLRKIFLKNNNKRSDTFYRYVNEFPTLLLITIIILVVVKPF